MMCRKKAVGYFEAKEQYTNGCSNGNGNGNGKSKLQAIKQTETYVWSIEGEPIGMLLMGNDPVPKQVVIDGEVYEQVGKEHLYATSKS